MAVVTPRAHELGRGRLLALGIAIAWSTAMIAGAFLVPAYSTDGSGTSSSNTLVGENGAGVAVVISIPLAVSLLVAALLSRRLPNDGAGAVAWTLTGLLALVNLLGMLTIGVFVLPVTVALAVACSYRPGPSWPQAGQTPRA